jgi:predicted metalloprotease with PDZ domain
MMRVKDYPGIADWPPQPGGAFRSGQRFPADEKVLITKIFPVMSEFVTFTCSYDGAEHTYDLRLTDRATAEEFARLLSRHVGATLEVFGDFRLDI